MHLRSAGYYGAKKLGHGIGYEYPHDDPRGWVPQEHRPPEVAGRVYYQPSDHGFEPARDAAKLRDKVALYRSLGARVSVFVDAEPEHWQLHDVGRPDASSKFDFTVKLAQGADNTDQGKNATATYTWDSVQLEGTTYNQ